MIEWISVGSVGDIPKLGARIVETPQGPVAVIRTADDSIFAIHNRCPHRGGPLSEGIVHDHKVTCPLHNWVIDLETGKAEEPDVGCTPTVPVSLKDGEIWLQVDVGLKVVHG